MTPETAPAEIRQQIAGNRMIVPSRLSVADRAQLAKRLYDVHRRIFAGVSEDGFYSHVVDPPAERTLIQLYLAADGQIIGYCAMHRYRRSVDSRDAIVLRAEAGLMPGYRGRGATYGFGMRQAFAEKLKHPFTPVYYFGTLVHTSSYHFFCKYFRQIYPHPSRRMPDKMQDIALELADSFSDPPVNEADPLVRDAGWITIETPQEKVLNLRSDRSDVRFFRDRNPGYSKGHGMVVLVPITYFNITAAIASWLCELALYAFGYKKPTL